MFLPWCGSLCLLCEVIIRTSLWASREGPESLSGAGVALEHHGEPKFPVQACVSTVPEEQMLHFCKRMPCQRSRCDVESLDVIPEITVVLRLQARRVVASSWNTLLSTHSFLNCPLPPRCLLPPKQAFIIWNFGDVLGCVLLLVFIKLLIVALVMKSFGFTWEASTLAGACMAQVV